MGYSIAPTERVNLLSGMPGPTNEGLFLRCLKPLDELVSVKLLLRIWGPRFEFFVRLILVATFLDDSIRVARNFSEHTDQVVAAGQPLADASPDLIRNAAAVVLGAGLLAQSLGSICLVALIQPDVATKALIGWAIVQPVLYAQLTNLEFVAESLSLIGGLLIMRAHLSEQAKRDGRRVPLGGGTLCVPADPDSAPELAIARTQLLGRLLLPSVYLYRALTLLASLADANPNPNPIPNPIPIPNRRLLLLHHGAAAGLPVLCDSRQLPRRPAVRQHHQPAAHDARLPAHLLAAILLPRHQRLAHALRALPPAVRPYPRPHPRPPPPPN